MGVKNYALSAAGNTSISGVSIAESCPIANLNDSQRNILTDVRWEVASFGASTITAAATPTLDAEGGAQVIDGTTTITGFATATAGLVREVHFATSTPLTHSSTFALPGAANLTTAQGDVFTFRSKGAALGWKCVGYAKQNGTAVSANVTSTTSAGNLVTITGTDSGASSGPFLLMRRDSASPAANDGGPVIAYQMRDNAASYVDIGTMYSILLDPVAGTVDSQLAWETRVAGTLGTKMFLGQGLQVGPAPSGGDKGSGTVNAQAGLYIAGHGTVAQVVNSTSATYQTCSTDLPCDNTIPQITEGDEILSIAITPTNSSSVLYIDVTLMVGAASAGEVAAALFVDATAAALNASNTRVNSAAGAVTLAFTHIVSAGSTSSRTYRVRLGPDVGGPASAFLNGDNSSRKFGGIAASMIRVTEVLPQ